MAAVNMGIHVVTAAGNEDSDACNVSPASASPGTPVITVGSTNRQDRLSSFSNWGTCVDILAPGEDVVAASHKGDTQATQNSGTSFSCPTVAGVMALHLGNNVNQGVAITPGNLKSTVIADSTPDVIAIPSGQRRSTPNKLVYSGAEQLTAPGTTRPPANNFQSYPPETYGDTGSSSSISTGAIVGICLGIALIGGLIAYFWIRSSKNKKKAEAQEKQYQEQMAASGDVKYQTQTVAPVQYAAAPATATYAPPVAGATYTAPTGMFE
jgi:subtilisin family serine protease